MADPFERFPAEPLEPFRLSGPHIFVEPEYSDWRCVPFGMIGGTHLVLRPLKGQEPNWFWRWMQYLAFGNRWTKVGRDG